MRIFTEAVRLPWAALRLEALREAFSSLRHPVRFVVTASGADGLSCEIDCVSDLPGTGLPAPRIFDHAPRRFENTERFNAVLLVPTGIGAAIGGHCGDAGATARLLASACDRLITHPNAVNAADVNEMTENTLYVEGSILTRLLMGTLGLREVRSNRVLLLMDRHPEGAFNDAAVNVAGTARACLGIDCDVLRMEDATTCTSTYTGAGRASGEITGAEALFEAVAARRREYDAVGLTTRIEVPLETELDYYRNPGAINPWGGVEAMLTHSLAGAFDLPCAHAPMALTLEGTARVFATVGVVDPRKSADVLSRTYLFSILKGLHRAPRIVPRGSGLTVEDISCLVIPDGCVGLPTLAAMEQGIPVIAVRENRNLMRNRLEDFPFRPGGLFVVDNYLEAAGVMTALRAGVAPAAVRRPLGRTRVLGQRDPVPGPEPAAVPTRGGRGAKSPPRRSRPPGRGAG